MRYVVKWNNGAWKVFDTVRYEDLDIARESDESPFPTHEKATEIASRLNARKK